METSTLNESQLLLDQRRAIADLRAARPEMPFAVARNHIRQIHPELFGLPALNAAPASAEAARNRAASAPVAESKFRRAVDEFLVKNKMKFADAWRFMRDHFPALYEESYGGEASRQAQVMLNRGASDAAQAKTIQDGIDVIQKAQPGITYAAARQQLRQQNPAAFGL